MRIVIATGGSGGHVVPALCVAEELRKEAHEIFFLAAGGTILEKITKNGFQLLTLPAKGLSLSSPGSLFTSVSAMIRAFGRAFKFLKNFRPDVAAGFGGYGSFPVVLAAFFLGIPTLIHEQNVVPGRANRWLGVLVRRVAVSFEKTKIYFSRSKSVLTGCPCHNRPPSLKREEIWERFNLEPFKKTVVVMGGSQGSRRINEEFLHAARRLKDDFVFQVIHVAGKKDVGALRESYGEMGIGNDVVEFLDEMECAYSVADLIVSRAGALSVCEIASFAIPAILIPYPLAGGHQNENALVLQEAGLAEIIREEALSGEKLKEAILTMMTRPRTNFREEEIVIADAAQRLAKEVVSLKRL